MALRPVAVHRRLRRWCDVFLRLWALIEVLSRRIRSRKRPRPRSRERRPRWNPSGLIRFLHTWLPSLCPRVSRRQDSLRCGFGDFSRLWSSFTGERPSFRSVRCVHFECIASTRTRKPALTHESVLVCRLPDRTLKNWQVSPNFRKWILTLNYTPVFRRGSVIDASSSPKPLINENRPNTIRKSLPLCGHYAVKVRFNPDNNVHGRN